MYYSLQVYVSYFVDIYKQKRLCLNPFKTKFKTQSFKNHNFKKRRQVAFLVWEQFPQLLQPLATLSPKYSNKYFRKQPEVLQ